MLTTPLLALLALALQDLTHKAAPQEGPVLIVGATIHPISSEVIEEGWILFDEGRITELGKGRPERDQARTIDATGKHVWPGLVSAYSHLGLVEISAVRASDDVTEAGDVNPEVRAAVAINPDSTLLPVTRSNGILTFASFPTRGLVPGRPCVMRMDGWTWEDMALDSDYGLVVQWPRLRPARSWWGDDEDETDPLEEARAAQRKIEDLFDAAGAYLAARDADSASVPLDLGFEAMRDVLPAFAGERPEPVFALADDLDEIRSAVEFAARRRLKLVIVGGRDALACADLLRAHDVPVIVNGVYRLPKRDDSPYDEPFRLPADLEQAGVRWCLASGEETAHERNLPYGAALAVAHGLDADAAVRAITLSAARILGVDDRVGSLEVGKEATLIVTDGNPLEVTTRIERAYVQGRAIDLSNKQTKLAEKYREKYRQLDEAGAGK